MISKHREAVGKDTDSIKKEIMSYRGLCLGGCGKRVKNNSSMLAYIDNDYSEDVKEVVFYYLVCNKCLGRMNKDSDNKKTVNHIESVIRGNSRPYACLMYSDNINDGGENVVSPLSSRIKLNKVNLKSDWILDDVDYFENNPDRRFRYRKLHDGEIEEIEGLKNSTESYASSVSFVIVHKVAKDQRLKAFIGGEIDESKLMDEFYINALFIVMTLNLGSEKIDEVYTSLVEKNEIWGEFETFKFNYNN